MVTRCPACGDLAAASGRRRIDIRLAASLAAERVAPLDCSRKMDAVKEESIGNFMAIASCDREFDFHKVLQCTASFKMK